MIDRQRKSGGEESKRNGSRERKRKGKKIMDKGPRIKRGERM